MGGIQLQACDLLKFDDHGGGRPASQRRQIAENLILIGILVAQLTGTPGRLAVERAHRGQGSRGSSGTPRARGPGAGDLLAEVAGVFERTYEWDPDEPLKRPTCRGAARPEPTRRQSQRGSSLPRPQGHREAPAKLRWPALFSALPRPLFVPPPIFVVLRGRRLRGAGVLTWASQCSSGRQARVLSRLNLRIRRSVVGRKDPERP